MNTTSLHISQMRYRDYFYDTIEGSRRNIFYKSMDSFILCDLISIIEKKNKIRRQNIHVNILHVDL